ncbi:fasciclin domain-containing protein [Botryobacter ruber]|uniref:fasciclin domain-containing protein n=1 Tax=Botryobacter ruber TaxID=2171629 RepID=UPI000E0A42D0|nr:fasciclin domain-containing protein [Botryobacter ruber]
MKREMLCPLVLFMFSVLLPGCSSTDTTTDVEVLDKSVAEQAYENAPDVPLGDTTDEEQVRGNVSVDNQVGRDMSIVAIVQQNPDLSTLLELVKAAGMVNVLQSPASYTFFAPNNKAFEALPAGTVENLKRADNQTELKRLLQAHVLNNKLTTADMQASMTEKTAQGDDVIIKRNGQVVLVGGATVLRSDLDASNGVVHIIDKVLVPPQE